jgi:hypothetical protein
VDTRTRRIAIVAGILALAGLFFAIAVTSSDTSETSVVASNVESVTPPPGGLARPSSEIRVDLADGLVGRLSLDGQVVPDDQIDALEGLGQYSFRPGPGQIIEIFEAGTHQAEIFYWPSDEPEPPAPQSYKWEFRVTS